MKSLMSLTDTKNQTDKREIEEVLNHLEDSLVENKVNPSAVSRGAHWKDQRMACSLWLVGN